jgi:hypothetical protein
MKSSGHGGTDRFDAVRPSKTNDYRWLTHLGLTLHSRAC